METYDFSFAGCRKTFPPFAEYPAESFGIFPGGGEDLSPVVQRAIEAIGRKGGGALVFGKGDYAFDRPLLLDFSNFAIRGAGPETRLRLRKPQTQHHASPWLSPALITAGSSLQSLEKFWGVKPSRPIIERGLSGAGGIEMTGDIEEPEFLTGVEAVYADGSFDAADLSRIKPGDHILLIMRNNDDDGTLLKRLLAPCENFHPLQRSALLAGPSRAASFQFLAEVASLKGHRVRLATPIPETLDMRFTPELYRVPTLRNIVVEKLTFACDWRGPYLHHGGGLHSPEESNEMDYGWNAVKFFRCADCVIHDLKVEDYSSAVELIDCTAVTVSRLHILDHDAHGGHYGVKVYAHAANNLFCDITLDAYRTHAVSCEGNSYGNVFRNFIAGGDNALNPSEFDLHGFADLPFAPPGHNLFEHFRGIGRITGGGSKFNLPHCGRGNVFRDIEFDPSVKNLFYSWIAADTGGPDADQFPGSILEHLSIKA